MLTRSVDLSFNFQPTVTLKLKLANYDIQSSDCGPDI